MPATKKAPNAEPKTYPPVQGNAAWTGPHMLTIATDRGSETYDVRTWGTKAQLDKTDGTTYQLDLDRQSCSCPDHTYRKRICKHLSALNSALLHRPN